MTSLTGAYSFLPHLRRGIANRIGASAPTGERATVAVSVKAVGDGGPAPLEQAISRMVELYGPGDIVGIDPRAIVRVEPRNLITNFEPNYLAFVEFYDEDFPWRYSPVAPDGNGRLAPWLALLVLEEDVEFDEGGTPEGAKLPTILVDDLTLLPPADQLWAWAHVHVNRSLAGDDTEVASDDMGAVLPRFEAVLGTNPDLASSRILCPRRLRENKAYHAFLVPAFESGRLAGLGLDPSDTPSLTHSAWDAAGRPDPTRFCYYHRWYFRTGTVGDFEYLVRLLQARPVDPRVGQRDMDVLRPGSDLPAIADPTLGGVLRLGGALKVPASSLDDAATAEAERYEQWDAPFPHPFQTALAAFVNLADDYLEDGADDPDPLVTPPLYGRWHALASRVLEPTPSPPATHANWVHELNLDPRFRVAAGFGTDVVQRGQEDYMAAAWGQIGQVLEANRRIRLGQLATAVAARWHVRHLQAQLAAMPSRALLFTAPVHGRLLVDGVTIRHQVATSTLTAAPLSAAMRRVMRPGSPLVRALPFTQEVPIAALPARVAAGDVAAAPPKAAPPGAVTLDQVAEALRPSGVPRPLLTALARVPWLRLVPLVLALVVLVLVLLSGAAAALGAGAVLAAVLVALWRLLERWRRAALVAEVVTDEAQTPEAVDALPRSPDFELSSPGLGFRPRRGAVDSVVATRFKAALRHANATLVASRRAAEVPPRPEVDVAGLADAAVEFLRPERTIPRRVLWGIDLPARVREPVVEQFKEAMAYLEIDSPMYKPLVDLSSELFVPNLNLIGQNTITLLETNQRFIEAYMVGLNHEFARELLWREYPTDQRGSSFRQFWDVRTYLPRPGESTEDLRERLRDIPPLHRWSLGSALGSHDHREAEPGAAEEEVVLVIRGELLKKYPTAVIYAQKAEWARTDDAVDPSKERMFVDLTAAEEADPPRDKLRNPLYEAKVDPDIYFFGFDLTAEDARGGNGDDPDDDAGWFFVIRERPGDPRFGFDIERSGDLEVWNDLAWSDVAPTGAAFVDVGPGASTFSMPTGEPAEPEKVEQWQDDKALTWGPAMRASEVAYISYQAPVLVAVHAQEMLAGA